MTERDVGAYLTGTCEQATLMYLQNPCAYLSRYVMPISNDAGRLKTVSFREDVGNTSEMGFSKIQLDVDIDELMSICSHVHCH